MKNNWDTKYGKWALVTGASSGLGTEFAYQLAKKGLDIILVARRKERLEEVAESIDNNYGRETQIIVQDLSLQDSVEKVKGAVGEREVGILINNAGFGLVGQFHTFENSRVSEMVKLNCVAPAELAHAFLPQMIERGKGAIIFVASTAAYQATPYFSVYGATKVFNLFLGESLWEEYRKEGIDILTLSPGYTETEFHKVAGSKHSYRAGAAQSHEVVATALINLDKVPSVIHGNWNRFLAFSQKFFPKKFVLSTTGKMMKKMRDSGH